MAERLDVRTQRVLVAGSAAEVAERAWIQGRLCQPLEVGDVDCGLERAGCSVDIGAA